MSQEIVMCGKLSVIMKYSLRNHYEDFVQQATNQVFIFKILKRNKKYFVFD
jgi:hypothetical protein